MPAKKKIRPLVSGRKIKQPAYIPAGDTRPTPTELLAALFDRNPTLSATAARIGQSVDRQYSPEQSLTACKIATDALIGTATPAPVRALVASVAAGIARDQPAESMPVSNLWGVEAEAEEAVLLDERNELWGAYGWVPGEGEGS